MEHKEKTFYGRRKGRILSRAKGDLLLNRIKEFELDLPLGLPAAALAGRMTLEIGYGSGEHLAEYAKKRPDEFFIGAEAFENGNAAMIRSLVEAGLKNVKIFPDDANLLFPHLPDGMFTQIFILYPDPWPKSRHEARRMVSPERARIFARLLKPGGRLLVVSDHPVYIPHTLRVVTNSGLFEWTAKKSPDFTRPPSDWDTTRYEQKALKEGRIPIYLEFIKK
jgi:tRNA (guanine-N7-)-methyltransferase